MALVAFTAAALLGGICARRPREPDCFATNSRSRHQLTLPPPPCADPKGHFKHVTKCTTGNFDGFVKEQVDSGKTLFVRWIASEG